MAYPRTSVPSRKRLKETLVHVYNSYGEEIWCPEMFLGDAYSGQGIFFFFMQFMYPLHPTLNNVQFSSVGADVFILCYLKSR